MPQQKLAYGTAFEELSDEESRSNLSILLVKRAIN